MQFGAFWWILATVRRLSGFHFREQKHCHNGMDIFYFGANAPHKSSIVHKRFRWSVKTCGNTNGGWQDGGEKGTGKGTGTEVEFCAFLL